MNNLKRYKEITGKEFIGNDYSIEKFQSSKAVSNLIKEIEKLEHYKHLYSEVKKQKDDVAKYIKNLIKRLEEFDIPKRKETGAFWYQVMGELEELLRMLGEIDVKD